MIRRLSVRKRRKVSKASSTTTLTLQAAADGLGVTLGPRPIVDDELNAGRLVMPLAGPMVRARGYWWVIPNSRAGDPVLRAFCDWLARAPASASQEK